MTEKAFIFDDGSIESKVLQHELKQLGEYEVQTISVPGNETLKRWFDEFKEQLEDTIKDMKNIIKIFLHFPGEDYVQKDIRDQVMDLQRRYPNLRIVLYYEMATRDSLERHATNYGIAADIYDKTLLNRAVAEKEVSPETKEVAEQVIKDLDSRDNFIARREDKSNDTFQQPEPKKRKRRFAI